VKSHRAQLAALRNDFKQWLRQNAPRARVTSEFDVALNAVAVQLNGTSLATIRSAPQVLYAEYQGLYRPTAHDDPDLGLIDAFQAWQLAPAGPERAGEGVKIAIIDSGIDVRHPCFSDAGYPEGNAADNIVNGGTNDKVIYAEAFYNKLAKSGFGTADLNGHGTHVAGTAACNAHTPAWIDDPSSGPVDIPYDPSGVAPGAMLGNFNIFPGTLASARSEDILNALQRAYELGFDVANMSLGGGSNGVRDLLSQAVDGSTAPEWSAQSRPAIPGREMRRWNRRVLPREPSPPGRAPSGTSSAHQSQRPTGVASERHRANSRR
jgi:subtilisin family serine protease